MKTKILAMMLLAGGAMFAQTRFSVGIGFGGQGAGFYQPPPAYASNIPPCPGPDYTWVDGYWSQDYGRSSWVAGYWNRRPIIDRHDRQEFTRGVERDRNRGFDQNRGYDQGQNVRGQSRIQTRAQDNQQGNGYASGFKGR